ncbi:large-conductance mechanosensitive channel protein MscL [Terrisporobacter sp.]
MRNLFKEFREFITRGNVVDLAVGVIIGRAFLNIINSIVNDVIMPLIGMISGRVEFSKLKWVLSSVNNNGHEVAIKYGNFIHACVDFFVISLCIFIFTTIIGRNPNRIKTKDEAQKEQVQKTNELLEEIRDSLKNNQ